jgi:hypothetical protein
MTNYFSSGTFYHPQTLWDAIDSSMIASGWSVQSTIVDSSDRVYFSTGEDGYAFNYIRVAHRIEDLQKWNMGWPQILDEDGYSDYVNFYAYQYFNSGGTNPAVDGYGEIGKFGPRLYANVGQNSTDIRWSNLRTGVSGDSRWTDMRGDVTGGDNRDRRLEANVRNAVFDGKNFIYYFAQGNFYKYNISTGENIYMFGFDGGGAIASGYIRERDRFAVIASYNSATSGSQYYKYEFDEEGTLISGTKLSNVPWGYGNNQRGSAAIGRYVYVVRGDFNDGGNTNVAVYDIVTDTWNSITALPATVHTRGSRAAIVPKGAGGITNHRLYVNRGINGSQLYFIDLQDTGLPVGGYAPTWQTATSLPLTPSGGSGLEFDGYGRLLYSAADAGSTGREFYYQDITPAGTASWTLAGVNYMWADINESSTIHTHYCNQARVRAFANEQQKYWIIVNKDRLIVVTKSLSGKYHHCYIGRIDSFYDDTTQVRTTSAVGAGVNQVVPVASTSQFTVGQRIYICDIDRGSPTAVTGTIQNITQNVIKNEHTQITAINPGTSITLAELKNDYPTNSLIGFDIQAVIATAAMTRYAMALNCVNTPGVGVGNNLASGDPAEQVYVYEPGVTAEYTALTDVNDRTGEFTLWPYLVFTEGTGNRFSGKEVRGQLIGMYSCGNGRGTSEDIINIGGQNYLLFDLIGMSDTRYSIVGPIL